MNLEFVTAEEAAKWPEGTPVFCLQRLTNGRLFGIVACTIAERRIAMSVLGGYRHFARLPDTLPDLSEEPSDVR